MTYPYTVHAVNADGTPAAIRLMAASAADAITTAQELYPQWRVSAVLLEEEWE